MAVGSISGINVKIGADLSDLKQELNTVGDTVESGLSPAKSAADDLSDKLSETARNAHQSSVNIQAIATALGTIGKAIAKTAWDSVKEAIEVNPELAQPYNEIAGAFNDLKIAFGEGLLQSLSDVAEPVTNVLNSITKFAKENPETASTLLSIVGVIGLLGSAAGTVAPILSLFNVSLGAITVSTLGVIGGIVALIAVLALLSPSLDEIGAKASQTAEEIGSMDTTTQHIVETGTGELKVENRDDYDWVANVWDPERKEFVEGWAYLDELTGEYVLVSEEVATGAAAVLAENATTVAEQGAATAEAGEQIADTVTDTATNAEQAEKILSDLKATTEQAGTTLDETDLNGKMQEVNDILQSAEFQQFTSIPLDPAVAESWNTFGGSVSSAADSFSDLTGELDKNSISGQLSDIGSAADAATNPVSNLAGAVGALAEAIKELNKVGPIKLPKLGGGGNGGSTDVFKASGGPVRAGSPYIVGEAGPELFVPRYNGEIIPNDEIGRSPAINVNIGNIYGESYLKDYVVRLMTGQIRKELRLAQ